MQQFEIMNGVIRAFRNRVVIFLLLLIIGVVATIVYTLSQPQSYRAIAVIQIESPQVAEPSLGTLGSGAAHRLQLIEQRLMARDNLMEKINTYNLYAALPDLDDQEKVSLLREAISINQIEGEIAGFGSIAVPSGLTISVQLGDPEAASALANDLVQQVIDQNEERRESQARETLSFFEQEEARLLNAVETLEEELAVFKQTNADILPSAMPGLVGSEAAFESNILDIDRQILSLKSDGNRQRDEFVDRQVAILEEQKTLLAERAAGVREKIQRAPEAERELGRLTRELTLFQGQYEIVTVSRSEAELSLSLEDRNQAERFEILETALPSETPVSTSRRLMFGIGLALSIIGAGIVIFIFEQMNPAIRNAGRLKSELDLTPVVSIPSIVSPREAFGQRLVIASMLAILFLVIPLVTIQMTGN
jgi:tyrosine-protein kinase Etk/Wzc